MPDYRAYAQQTALRAGIDPDMFVKQIQQESGFDPTAFNPSGATGIAQIVPAAHPGVDANDPIASLDYAANWMAGLHRNLGSYRKALAAYNWGPGNVSHWNGARETLPAETRRYLDVILGAGWPEPSGNGSSGGHVPQAGDSYIVREDQVRFRDAPALSGGILRELSEGTTTQMTGAPTQDADGHTWRQVSLDGQVGWIADEFLAPGFAG